MALLDIPSLFCLSRINRRYYHLHSDEYIWTDVDLTTVPKLNVQLVKNVIRDKLHPALWRLTLCSNAAERQRKPKLRPPITSSALDDIFRKCRHIRCIRLHNFDISQVYILAGVVDVVHVFSIANKHTMWSTGMCVICKGSKIR